MKYKTYLTTSLAVALPVLVSTGNLTVGNVIVVSFGALLPDIDEQHSWIGRRTRGVSDLMNMVFGHRRITHSLFGLVLVLIPILFAVFSLELQVAIPISNALHPNAVSNLRFIYISSAHSICKI